tara:strand:+ start:269 stop:847 length:579 start_codon:yes stop_codon:yes gene_type:complete
MYQYMIAEKLYGMEVLLDSIPEEHWRQAGTFKKGHPQEEIRRMKIRSPVETPLSGAEMIADLRDPQSCYMEVFEERLFKESKPIREFFDWFYKRYGGKHYRSNISILPPGKSVDRHIDGGPYYIGKDRFHLVLQGKYEYVVGREIRKWQAGDLFWFDNKSEHQSTNIGNVDRISIIFDVGGSDWRNVCGINV